MIAKLERSYRHFFFVSICRPFILWAQEPIIQLFGVYLAFVYGTVYRTYHRHCQRVLC